MTAFALLLLSEKASAQTTCGRTIRANVVALDQVFFYNRLGAVNPAGMIYALRSDVVPINPALGLVPGNVQLRDDKRAPHRVAYERGRLFADQLSKSFGPCSRGR